MIYTHDVEESRHVPYTGRITEPPPKPVGRDDSMPWELMREYLHARGLSHDNAVANGCYPIHRKGIRMYIPAKTRVGGHHYWQARSLDGHELRYDSPFGPRRDAIMVIRNYSLFSPGMKPRMAIVEGPLDAMAVAEFPGWIGIGLMGATPSEEALRSVSHTLNYYLTQEVVCIADRDGVAQMAKTQGWLAMKGHPSELRVPQGFKDICEGTQAQREELLKP